MREHANLKRLNDFLEGKSKHHHIFLFDQKADVINESGEAIDGHGESKVLVTVGEQERLKGRAVYFMRTIAEGKTVKMENGSDTELLYGEIAANPLESLETSLGSIFLPFLKKSSDWGQCDKDQT